MIKKIEDYIVVQDGEIWLPAVMCPEFYWVSTHGRIFSWKSWYKYTFKPRGILKMGTHSQGYKMVSFDFTPPIKVHRVVALTFIDNPVNKPEVHHKDHNPANNHIDNLEWVTHSENIQAYRAHSSYKPPKKGIDNPNYGKKRDLTTRSIMSAKKLGEKHPKFKGWYVINGVVYPSANQAGKALGIHPIQVTRNIAKDLPGWIFRPK